MINNGSILGPVKKITSSKNIFKNIRILEVKSECLIAASGYTLYKLQNGGRYYFSKINDLKYSILSKNRLLSRFFRAEIYFYVTLVNSKGICIAKEGIFLENDSTGKFEKVFQVKRGSRPLTLCEDLAGNIYFGEYFYNRERSAVHIYASYDKGENWKIVYTFPKKTIRHVHSIQLDPYTGFLWIATGDEEGECILAITRDKFKTLEIVAKGGQEFRTCKLLFLQDKIIYGTDSPYTENFIKAIDRIDLSFEQLQKVQGSVINACKIGDICIISTTVEPSKINNNKFSYLWISNNVKTWIQIAAFKKDRFNMTFFQFGNIRFPHYHATNTKSLFFSGHALEGIDGHSVVMEELDNYFKTNTE